MTDRCPRQAVCGHDAGNNALCRVGRGNCEVLAEAAVVDYLERFGSTARVRSNGGRLHPDSQGLTVAAFRQTTSRLDDPQLHTHLVISAKVRLAAAVTSLQEHATHEPAGGTQLLIDATLRWATKHRIELQPPPQPTIERTGIELDLCMQPLAGDCQTSAQILVMAIVGTRR
jgi:TrwC relaxase